MIWIDNSCLRSPIGSGDGYRDYILSDILSCHGFEMDFGEMLYASEPLVFVNGCPHMKINCNDVAFLMVSGKLLFDTATLKRWVDEGGRR